jgi:hypothetical protein
MRRRPFGNRRYLCLRTSMATGWHAPWCCLLASVIQPPASALALLHANGVRLHAILSSWYWRAQTYHWLWWASCSWGLVIFAKIWVRPSHQFDFIRTDSLYNAEPSPVSSYIWNKISTYCNKRLLKFTNEHFVICESTISDVFVISLSRNLWIEKWRRHRVSVNSSSFVYPQMSMGNSFVISLSTNEYRWSLRRLSDLFVICPIYKWVSVISLSFVYPQMSMGKLFVISLSTNEYRWSLCHLSIHKWVSVISLSFVYPQMIIGDLFVISLSTNDYRWSPCQISIHKWLSVNSLSFVYPQMIIGELFIIVQSTKDYRWSLCHLSNPHCQMIIGDLFVICLSTNDHRWSLGHLSIHKWFSVISLSFV